MRTTWQNENNGPQGRRLSLEKAVDEEFGALADGKPGLEVYRRYSDGGRRAAVLDFLEKDFDGRARRLAATNVPAEQGPVTTPGQQEEVSSPELQLNTGGNRTVGQNPANHTLTEDENGVRSYTADGTKHTEPVRMVPTRDGVRTEPRPPGERPEEFLTAPERDAKASTDHIKALTDEVRGLRDEIRGGTAEVAPERAGEDIQVEEATNGESEADQGTAEPLAGDGAAKGGGADGASGPRGQRGGSQPGSAIRDEDVAGADPSAGDGVPHAGVSSPAMGVARPGATGRPGREDAGAGAEADDVVAATAAGDDLAERRPAAGNLDLRDKPAIKLTLGQRRKINEQARSILAAQPEQLTDEQREVLRQYTGEGGLSSGSREALNQHYTDYQTIRAIFDAIEASGLQVGSALEPSVGSGNFVGNRPDYAWTTVDIDGTNHEVVKALYPEGTHYHMSFEDFGKSGYDLVISNVPFLETRGSGRHRNRPDIQALHDFYFVHAIDRVRPGGIVAFITSTGTMDKQDQSIRQEIVDKADVLATYRLPGGHFEANAHTKVTTDVIFLQRRPDGAEARTPDDNAAFVESIIGDESANLSAYYREHPDHILGDLELGTNEMYGGGSKWTVTGEADLSKIQLPAHEEFEVEATEEVEPEAAEAEPWTDGWRPDLPDFLAEKGNRSVRWFTGVPDAPFHEDVFIDDGRVYVKAAEGDFADVDTESGWKLYDEVTGDTAEKVRALEEVGRLAAEFQETDDADLADAAVVAIDSYRDRFKKHPSKDRQLRRFFKERGATSFVAEYGALFDEDFSPADVFLTKTRYVGSGRVSATADDPVGQRALHHEDTRGTVHIGADGDADLLSMEDVPALLGGGYGLLGLTEDSATLQNGILYYSGNIYDKVAEAEKVKAALDGGLDIQGTEQIRQALDRQLAELENVKLIPASLGEMDFKGNEPWVRSLLEARGIILVSESVVEGKYGGPPTTVRHFLLEPSIASQGPNASKYYDGKSNHPYNNYLNNKPLVSRARRGDELEPMVSYLQRLREARDEVDALRGIIREKILADDDLAERVEYAFNSKFRGYVKPDYEASSYLIEDVLAEIEQNTAHIKTKDGKPFSLRRNQVEWVIQAIYEGKGINAHDVGGGKTMAAITLARVMKKRGMAQKPIFVVPAKTIHKWVRETEMLFPDAKIVNLGKLSKEERERRLFALANTNADYVFVSHEGFANIQLPLESDMAYLEDVLSANLITGSGRSAGKQAVMADDYRDAVRSQPRDARLTFDKLGIDMIIADEAHAYKNIGMPEKLVREYSVGVGFGFNTNKEGEVTGLKSARSYDFRAKSSYIVDHNNGRNVFLLTATPATNKPMELYTMLMHLGPDSLRVYGIESATDFANMFFGFDKIQSPSNPNQDKGILSEIRNVPELRAILDRYVSKIPMEQMPWIKVPEEVSENHYLDASDAYDLVAQDLVDRQGNLKAARDIKKGDDTLVAIYQGGRSGSVDPRLYGGEHVNVDVESRTFDSADDKVQWAIERTDEVVKASKDNGVLIYVDDAGHTQTERGVMDRNLHREIKAELVKRGLNPKQVAIISGKEVTNPSTGKDSASGDRDQKKQDISDAYNAGKIRVLIGTTQSMGEGMDLQVKTSDIIHLDIPYVPGAIRQRNGRGVRYGNQHGKVRVHYLFMRGSFDQMSFEIIAHKKGWNEAIWDQELKPTLSVKEEMAQGATPPRLQIRLNLAKDPAERRKLELEFEREQLAHARQEAFAFMASAQSKVGGKEKQVHNLEHLLNGRQVRLREAAPAESIRDPVERREALEAKKANIRTVIEKTQANIERVQGELARVLEAATSAKETYDEADQKLIVWEAKHLDESGNVVKEVQDGEPAAEARTPLDHEAEDQDGIELGMGFDPVRAVRAAVAGARAAVSGAQKVGRALTEKPSRRFQYEVGSEKTRESMAMSRGATRPSPLVKIKELVEEYKNKALREWEFLPKTAEFAELRFALTKLQKQRGVASYKTIAENLDKVTKDLDKRSYDLFTLKVILDDLVNEANEGRHIPWFNTVEGDEDNVYDAMAEVDAWVEDDPAVLEAVRVRTKIWRDLKNEFIGSMRAVGFNVEDKLDKDSYYRHQVLDYAQMRGGNRLAGTKGMHTPTYRGYLRERKGSSLPINTDYLEAEYEVMAQMLYDIERVGVIRTVGQQHNVLGSLKAQARQHNDEQIGRVFQAMADRMNENQPWLGLAAGGLEAAEEITAEKLYRQMLNKKQAMGFEKLSQLARMDELPDNGQWGHVIEGLAARLATPLPGMDESEAAPYADPEPDTGQILAYASWVVEKHPGTAAAAGAKMIFKGIREKAEYIHEALTKLGTFRTWEDFIPDGYVSWQPQEGNTFYLADTIPARAAQAIAEGALSGTGISPEEIKKAFVMGGRRREFIIPEEVAAQLESMQARHPGPVARVFAFPQRLFKINILLNPRRYPKYNIRNLTGDADAVFMGNPSAFKKAPRATRELYASMVGVRVQRKGFPLVIRPEKLSGELREWFVRGGAGSSLSVQEMEEVGELRIFKHRFNMEDLSALQKLVRAPARMWKGYWKGARITTDFREAILRYAAYLDYLEQIQRNKGGRPDNFGASRREEIMALKDPRDRAFKLSNDLLGAYDEVGVLGQELRRYVYPFWSWNEVNARRFKRLIANAAADGALPQAIGRKVLGTAVKSPFRLARAGKFLIKLAGYWAMLQAWNLLLFPDEEKGIPQRVRERPHFIFPNLEALATRGEWTGFDAEGKALFFSKVGVLGDFLEWFGLDAAPSLVSDVLSGKMSPIEAAKDVAAAPVEKLIQGVSPLYTTPEELLMGRKLFPDPWHPRTIRDNGLYLSYQLGMQEEYRALAGLPWKDYQDTAADLFVYRADPLQSAYSATFEARQKWLKDQGRERDGFMITPRSTALYNLRLAVRYSDEEAEGAYLRKYLEAGGTMKGIQSSFARMHPLGSLSKKDARAFAESLDGREQAQLLKAIQFYDEVLLGPGPDGVVFRNLDQIRDQLTPDDVRSMVARQDALARAARTEDARRVARRRRDRLVAPYGGLKRYLASLSRARPPRDSQYKTPEIARFFNYRSGLVDRLKRGEDL